MKKRYLIALIVMLFTLSISYKFWLIFKTVTSAKFDFYIFVIIAFVSYLGGLKLTDYLADLKDIEHQSRIEISFVLIFFLILFIPMSHINKDIKSNNENRNLAKYKPLFVEKYKLNYNFGNDFNNWFNDRFNFRYPLFVLNNRFKLIFNPLLETKDAFYNRKTNFFGLKSHINYDAKIFTTELQNKAGLNLRKLNEFCENNNIKLYILVVSYSEDLYIEKLDIKKNKTNKIDSVISSVHEKAGIKIIYPINELKEAKKNGYVYYKTDHHWSEYGAYIGYHKLISEIRKDFSNVPIQKESDFNISYNTKICSEWDRNFGIGGTFHSYFPYLENNRDKILDVQYKYYDNKNKNLLKSEIIDLPKKKQKNFYYPNGADLRVLQIGTSMNENLLEFTPYSYKNLKYIRINGVKGIPNENEAFKIMKYHKREILSFKPDIMILCLVPYNFYNLDYMFKEAE